jgi:hypothetical protein
MKKQKRIPVPDLTEFTDEEGKRWKQTSTEDLFSMKELNTILETIEKERVTDEIILARIDFQRVNKEYYDAAVALQKKLKKQGDLLKQVIIDSKNKIERKNKKLKELIEYIKKLHLFIAYLNKNQDVLDTMKIPPEQLVVPMVRVEEEAAPEMVSVYEEVEESELTFDDEK